MPIWKKPGAAPARIDVLLFERFSNHCLANAVEPLRAANELLGRRAYAWRLLTLDDRPATSSSGMPALPTGRFADGAGDLLFVMPSYGHRELATPGCARALRAASRRYGALASLDTGSWLLASAGLLDGRPATIHFDLFDRFAERFPQVRAERERWVDDGDRLSAGGATATFELVLHLLARTHGEALALEVASVFLVEPDGAGSRLGATGDRVVDSALREMERSLERPLSIPDVAERIGRSQRELEARFTRRLGASPRDVYRRLRLNHARRLAAEESMSIAEIAARSGYADASAFARAFRREFGSTPSALRAGVAPSSARRLRSP